MFNAKLRFQKMSKFKLIESRKIIFLGFESFFVLNMVSGIFLLFYERFKKQFSPQDNLK
jgi:hypothetical protein